MLGLFSSSKRKRTYKYSCCTKRGNVCISNHYTKRAAMKACKPSMKVVPIYKSRTRKTY